LHLIAFNRRNYVGKDCFSGNLADQRSASRNRPKVEQKVEQNPVEEFSMPYSRTGGVLGGVPSGINDRAAI
jgi:hypothetical protein